MEKIRNILKSEEFQKWGRVGANILFPVILLLFPLVKINQGIDLTDTAYSLGNYRFFGQESSLWMLLTFLSNVLGNFFTKLPFGMTMVGMKFYTSLLISLMALLGYRFFKTKMPAWLAFAGEMAAIGLCWCPSVILYNYLTYVLFLTGAIFLFRGLAGKRPVCLVIAGICLGLNANVRFPGNVLEVALIAALWYYGYIKHKSFKEVMKETGLCVAGYVAALGGMFLIISFKYGFGAYGEMISGVFGMTESASDYTLGEMILSIFDAYLHGFKWMLYMILCILPGIPFMVLWKDKFPKLKKIVYCVCIAFLFFVLGKWGMYNFRYYQKESALQWGAIFLLLGIGISVWMMLTRALDDEWKLIGSITFIIILITPLGSNNYIWPALNNLFFVSPVIFWMVYRFVRWGRIYLDTTHKVPLFSTKAMVAAVLVAFWIQAVGVGCFYVFLDGESGEKRSALVEDNPVLKGMYTTEWNAKNLEEISVYFSQRQSEYEGKKLIMYGNIPGLAYYLDRPSAVYTTWPDLDSNSLAKLEEDLDEISWDIGPHGKFTGSAPDRPLVILASVVDLYVTGNQEAMASLDSDVEGYKEDKKLAAIIEFMTENGYQRTYAGDAFVIYE